MSSKKKSSNKKDLCSGFQNLSLNDGSNRPPVNPNRQIIDNLGTKPVWYRNVHPTENDYEEIENMITNDSFIIENVVEVNNDVLRKAYAEKKKEKMKQFKGNVEEMWLFHGTSKANVDAICTYNFDWRLSGNNYGHKYGKGINFSTNAMYAGYYSDKSDHKVMIVAKVLVANACQGNPDMVYPPSGYDTSQKDDGIVTVKYDDNEFYPAYKLYYHIEEDDDDDDDDDDDSSDDDDFSDDDDDDDYYY